MFLCLSFLNPVKVVIHCQRLAIFSVKGQINILSLVAHMTSVPTTPHYQYSAKETMDNMEVNECGHVQRKLY